MNDETERRMDSGYLRAQFEQIQATLCELKTLPAMMARLQSTVEDVVTQVKVHDVTLYGEKQETGLVGRVERLEVKLNQIWAMLGIVGGAILLWLVNNWLGLIKPTP
jgi:hypothetical protein